jgi:REP element-mobilizing transposase RayT
MRIKISADEGPAVYHCVTRTVNGEWLLDDVAKEVLRKQLWQIAEYCGVQIVTYAILSNHLHVLIRVPKRQEVSDAELMRRYTILHPRPSRYQMTKLDIIKTELERDGPEAIAWRKRQLALMGDVSQFMKLLKQRFSIWFNKSHQRFGTLWAERFKSVLVEDRDHVLQTMAAYIELNAVRAGLTTDPKDYRFCGYAEAVAGNQFAQLGIRSVTSGDWKQAQAHYREVLFGTGAAARDGNASISAEDLQRVVQQGGILSHAAVLRCRLRFFSDGAVLGSRVFVALHLVRFLKTSAPPKPKSPQSLPVYTKWGDLATMRRVHLRYSSG